jgi:hypothetical protein
MIKSNFCKRILCRDRACPCPNDKKDNHEGCPYENLWWGLEPFRVNPFRMNSAYRSLNSMMLVVARSLHPGLIQMLNVADVYLLKQADRRKRRIQDVDVSLLMSEYPSEICYGTFL